MLKIILIFLILCIVITQQAKRVAIVGAGISGAYLSKLLLNNKNDFKVDLYESGSLTGGRIQTIPYNNTVLDVGAKFFLKEHKIINNLIDEYKFEKESFSENGSNSIFGIFDNNYAINFELGSSDIINAMKMMFRYGMSPIKLKMQLEEFENKEKLIYDMLEKKILFRNIEELINVLNLKEYVNRTMSAYVSELGLNDIYTSEMVNASIRGIYNQEDVSVFGAFCALAKQGKEFFTIKGGNRQIVDAVIKTCKGSNNFKLYLDTNVISISKQNPAGKYILTSSKGSEDYDLIIIASPLSVANIKFTDLLQHLNKYNSLPKPVPVHVTYIEGQLNDEVFGTDAFPKILIPEKPFTNASINSIFNFNGIYRIQSLNKLTQSELEGSKLFKEGFRVLNSFGWTYAMGRLEPILDFTDVSGYMLDTRLFYASAHEAIASGMEMSLQSAQNVVNIIEDTYLMKKTVKEDI
jgi:prenylcysteine oxidase/farnesylcysteine lyase